MSLLPVFVSTADSYETDDLEQSNNTTKIISDTAPKNISHTLDSSTRYHAFEFRMQPAVANQYSTNSTEVELVLQKYVDDMNHILAKNTNRQLTFTATTGTDILIMQEQDFSTGCCITEQLEDKGDDLYPIFTWIQDTNSTYSYSGYTSVNGTGAGILNGMYWTQLYDPDTLTADTVEMRNYWTQINTMLHEIGHVFGAGFGEYYNFSTVDDKTGISPQADIRRNSSPYELGNYWNHFDKTTTRFDPMTITGYGQPISGSVTDYAGLLDIVEFGELSSAVINGTFRVVGYNNDPNRVPLFPINMNQTVVHVINATDGSDVVGADVKIWGQHTSSGNPDSVLIYEGTTNSTGRYEFDISYNALNEDARLHASGAGTPDMIKLVKVYKDNFLDGYDWISVMDAVKTRQIDGSQYHVLTISLTTIEVDLLDTSTISNEQ
jgi:hypothetical protein